MPPFSFVHAADLHLDSPFTGISKLPEEQQHVVQELREATFLAYDALINLCLEQQVDFLLVAGDVYDGANRSLRAQLRFRDGLQRLSEQGIRSYIIHGNHDPLDGWSNSIQKPELTHFFGHQWESVVFEKQGIPLARIHGISYPSRNIPAEFGSEMKRTGTEPFQIALFHCNAGGDQTHDPYAPRSLGELEAAGFDYWALGHIHERRVLREFDPFVGYPGNTQGRHANERGPRGCFLAEVTADGRMITLPRFFPTDRVRWENFSVDIANIETIDELRNQIYEQFDLLADQAEGRPLVVRVTITGRGPLHQELSRAGTLSDMEQELRSQGSLRSPFVWLEKLQQETRSEIDLASRREAQDFLGDLLRLIEHVRHSPEEQDQLKQEVLKDLYLHTNAKRFLDLPGVSPMHALLEKAEVLCADLLVKEKE